MNNPLKEPLVCIRIREAEKLQVILRSYCRKFRASNCRRNAQTRLPC